MKMGLIGFASSGKTTVFNSLTGQHIETGGFSAGKGKLNLGVTKVPDVRIDTLSRIFKPKKTTYAEVQFADLPPGSPDGTKEGLDPQMLAQIRELDALSLVLREFESPNVAAPLDPLRDLRNMEAELLLADLSVVEKRVDKIKKEKGKEKESELLDRIHAHLNEDRPLRLMALSPDEEHTIRGYRFLSQKPILVVLNTTETGLAADHGAIEAESMARGGGFLVLSAAIEADIAELDPEAQSEFLRDLGLSEPARARYIKEAYRMLRLISFLTAGDDEVRAWPITEGTNAVKAAGKIHSDIERGFIRAEVTAFDDFVKYGSEAQCKANGKFFLQGKEYVVKDGEIVHFRFNVG